jgi:prolyl-tRNA synthetase
MRHLAMKNYAFEVDDCDIRGGEKSLEWIKKGVPMRIEIGTHDIQSDTLCVRRRDGHNPSRRRTSNS